MAITVNTNISSLIVQQNLNTATNNMNKAMERMTTGLRINSSADDAAGMAVSTKMDYKVNSLAIAQDNGQMGASLLETAEGVLNILQTNLSRIRDLTEQAANGTYGEDSMSAISTEIQARFAEISRVSKVAEFNGIYLLDGSRTADINLQVGIENNDDSIIKLDESLFADASTSSLIFATSFTATDNAGTTVTVSASDYATDAESAIEKIYTDDTTARAFLTKIDEAIGDITQRKTLIGGNQQRILSSIDTAQVMQTNLTSASSVIKDADIAVESSNYIKYQILQQASATLLSTANQSPNIALALV